MAEINKIVHNDFLMVAVTSWFIAQLIKILLELLKNRRFDPSLLLSAGGMPSSHTAFVVAAATIIGLKHGFDSAIFALSAVLSIIVMYDAMGVRQAAGKQAAAINMLIEHLNNPDISVDTKLKELLGHTPLQVIAGAVLGIVVSLSILQY